METLTPTSREKVMAVVDALPAILTAKGFHRPGKTEFERFEIDLGYHFTATVVLAIDYDDSGLPYEADATIGSGSNRVTLRRWTADEIQLAAGTERVEFEFGGARYETDNVMFHALDVAANDHYYRTRPAVYHRAFAYGIVSGRISERE